MLGHDRLHELLVDDLSVKVGQLCSDASPAIGPSGASPDGDDHVAEPGTPDRPGRRWALAPHEEPDEATPKSRHEDLRP